MTDEEWEQIRPLVEAYYAASKARDAYTSEATGSSRNAAAWPVIDRASIESTVANMKSALALSAAEAALEDKCFSLLGVKISV